MDIGISIRNMGSQSSREIIAGAALAAETLGFESIWITDHIAIPLMMPKVAAAVI